MNYKECSYKCKLCSAESKCSSCATNYYYYGGLCYLRDECPEYTVA